MSGFIFLGKFMDDQNEARGEANHPGAPHDRAMGSRAHKE